MLLYNRLVLNVVLGYELVFLWFNYGLLNISLCILHVLRRRPFLVEEAWVIRAGNYRFCQMWCFS